jgi:hypothetical protein
LPGETFLSGATSSGFLNADNALPRMPRLTSHHHNRVLMVENPWQQVGMSLTSFVFLVEGRDDGPGTQERDSKKCASKSIDATFGAMLRFLLIVTDFLNHI